MLRPRSPSVSLGRSLRSRPREDAELSRLLALVKRVPKRRRKLAADLLSTLLRAREYPLWRPNQR